MWLFILSACAGDLATPPSYMGRPIAQTMSAAGTAWLTRPEREQEEKAQKMLDALGLQKGQTACDVGAGNGYHSLELAERVGKKGKVVATDIQPRMLELLRERAATAEIENIETVLSSQGDAKLPEGGCDLVLLVDVYHELSDPEAMLADIRRALTPTGRVALVEYRKEDPGVPMKPLHKMSVEQCDKELEANGFTRVGRFDALPWQHLLFYGLRAE